jgi:hypothetical protein
MVMPSISSLVWSNILEEVPKLTINTIFGKAPVLSVEHIRPDWQSVRGITATVYWGSLMAVKKKVS